MIFKNVMSFRAKIKQLAKEKGLTTQQVQQNFLIEVFLIKLSKSKYKENFIIKGGYLIGGIVGLDMRSTMDLDTTIKGFELTAEVLSDITKDIIETPTDESFTLMFEGVEEIRETDDYPGYKIKLRAQFEKINEVVTIDVTTGDAITPKEVDFSFSRMFSDDDIGLLSYPVETILAEKIETILSRGIVTTRPRDFYDIYLLSRIQNKKYSSKTLKDALNRTMTKRNSSFAIKDYTIILREISESDFQRQLWTKYQKQFSYAKDTAFDEVLESVRYLLKIISM